MLPEWIPIWHIKLCCNPASDETYGKSGGRWVNERSEEGKEEGKLKINYMQPSCITLV